MDIDFILNVFATLSGSVLTWFFICVLAPKYKNWMSPAPKLNETWNYSDLVDSTWKEVGKAQLVKNGSSITMELHRTKNREGLDCEKRFACTGSYKNGYILVYFEEIGSGGTISGSIVLHLNTNRKSMKGYTVYFDGNDAKVVSFPIKFTIST